MTQTVYASIYQVTATVALLVGGLIGYVRYIRGRTLRSNCGLAIDCHLSDIHGTCAVLVNTMVENTGSLLLIFSYQLPQSLTVQAADKIMWEDACTSGEMIWSEGETITVDILTSEGVKEGRTSLEPGECMKAEFLIPLPTGEWTAYRIKLEVTARPQLIFRRREPLKWSICKVVIPDGG